MKLSDKHINLTKENDVREIAKPFFDISGINYFFYTELFKNGSCFCLSSNAAWQKAFFEMKLYKLNTDFPANGYHLCATKNPIIAANAKEYFGIDNYLIFTKEYKDHYLMAGFGTNYGNDKILDYYINNRDMLNKFILYFQQKANNLIISSRRSENIIILPEYARDDFKLKQVDSYETRFLRKSQAIVLFSKRELDCIEHFLLGETIRETADKLLISPRTVETYLENIKDKLGCNKKSELIARLLKNGFTQNPVA